MSCRQLSPEQEQHYRAHLDYFSRDARVTVGDQDYEFAEADLEELAYQGRFFGVAGGLNSSVISGAIHLAKQRFRPVLARAQIIALCAATLKMTVEEIEHSLDWTANYMAFHDGNSADENHPYPTSEA
jgi:hypothetical protein